MNELEKAAQEALRLNHILVVSTILMLLEQAHDLDEARQKIRGLLELYAG